MQVELSRERFLELTPAAGERFYVTPRNVRVFLMNRPTDSESDGRSKPGPGPELERAGLTRDGRRWRA